MRRECRTGKVWSEKLTEQTPRSIDINNYMTAYILVDNLIEGDLKTFLILIPVMAASVGSVSQIAACGNANVMHDAYDGD